MEFSMTQEECKLVTLEHIVRVRDLLNKMVLQLIQRGELHDQSKLCSPELELFTEYTPQLAETTYGTPEYDELKSKLKPALDHHYANNSHHPEHYKNGIEDMNLLDLVEMLCDWKAASERHNDGNIRESIEINGKRFNMPDKLIKIFENSVGLL